MRQLKTTALIPNAGFLKLLAGCLLCFMCLNSAIAQEVCISADSNCYVSNGSSGCDDAACEVTVCAIDPFCCNVTWDGLCAAEAAEYCGTIVDPTAGCSVSSLGYISHSCATNFADISGSGTPVAGATDSDDGGNVVALGFPFDFFGNTETDVGVSSNGYLTFGSVLSDWTNDPIPSTNYPNELIAPLWDDWNPAAGGDVYSDSDGFSFIAQWNIVPHFPNIGSATFQVELYTGTNDMEFRYNGFSLFSPTVGVENASGTEGISIDPVTIGQNACIRIMPLAIGIDVKPGSNPNCVNTRSGGQMSVALLGSDSFDVSVVDVDTLEFGETTAARCNFEDVNLDGIADLSCKFNKKDIVYPDFAGECNYANCAEMSLSGELLDGTPFSKVDWVCEAGGGFCEAEAATAVCSL